MSALEEMVGKGLRVNTMEDVALQGAGTLSLQTEDKANQGLGHTEAF